MMGRRVRLIGPIAAAVLAASCSGTQSALAPAGPQTGTIARLWWFFFVVLSAIYAIVIVMALVGVFRRRGAEPAADGAPMYGSPAAGAPRCRAKYRPEAQMHRKVIAAVALLCAISTSGGCGAGSRSDAAEITGGDPARGVKAIQSYGCGGCHTIRGVRGATGLVGPPLDNIASRVYLARHLPNSPQNMIKWIRFPQQVEPRTAMPDMSIPDQDARDITAYLYTLR
jgi:cytochrome c2